MSSAKKSASRENAVGEYAHALAHHLATTLPEGEDRGGYWDAALDLWPYLPEEQTLCLSPRKICWRLRPSPNGKKGRANGASASHAERPAAAPEPVAEPTT